MMNARGRTVLMGRAVAGAGFLALLAFALPDAAPAQTGGRITGTVTFVGTLPEDPPHKTKKDQEVCGATVPSETYLIGANKGIKNVVLTVEGPPAQQTAAKAVLDNNKCHFVPHVQAVVAGTEIEVRNSDPVLHNTHSYLDKRTVFNLALPLQGQKIRRKLSKPGIVEVKCDAHDWMRGWIVVREHPYFGVSEANGAYRIENVPPGKYKLTAWHEALGSVTKEVTVPAVGTVQVDFQLRKR
ncbi:MAG: carboxypeptidase regulatory-like domain-containing protein [Deltaproteobacteria bacterium]|nr:carboxypeptidase regulatory-like domain-containing protein [Deltaproteobacteria bacterium]MBI3077188.1 carboxypeptidase regulatory-like domain-containing protein [Deltaproteobacteria bacterium]